MKKGWEIKMLSDVCDTGAGGTPLKAHKDYYTGGNIPWLQSGEVSQGDIYESRNFITEKGLKNSSARLFPTNTVLIAMYGATAGQVGILRFPATTNQAVCGILPNDKTIPEYLYYCFLLKKDELIAQAVGGAQPNISQIKIKNTYIPVPPLPEQHRIVTILNEAFAAIAKAKENAEKTLANARGVFETYLQTIYANQKEGWNAKQLGGVCSFEGGSQPSKDHFIYTANDGYIRLIQIRDYKTDDKKVYIPISLAKRFCDCNEIMIGRYGPPVFQILRGLNGAYNVALMKAIPNESVIEREFMFYFLQHRDIQNYVINLSQRAVGQTGISREDLEAYPIYFPHKELQSVITANINALLVETKRLATIYQQKLADLDELKKSILEKAFAGELNTN